MQRRSSLEAKLVVNIIGGFWIEVEGDMDLLMLLPVVGIEGGKRKRIVVREMYAREICFVAVR